MVRCLILFALTLATPAMAEDGAMPPQGASARAHVTVTILRGEAVGPLPSNRHVVGGRGDFAAKADRQLQRLPNDQIRIDFY